MFNLDKFISSSVMFRLTSMFEPDIQPIPSGHLYLIAN